MHCIGFYFHVPAGVHEQARAAEPSTPERADPPPRRRRACDSPKSRTARRQPHPPQPSGLTPTSAFAAATAPLKAVLTRSVLVGCTMVSFYVCLALLGTNPVLSTAPV